MIITKYWSNVIIINCKATVQHNMKTMLIIIVECLYNMITTKYWPNIILINCQMAVQHNMIILKYWPTIIIKITC